MKRGVKLKPDGENPNGENPNGENPNGENPNGEKPNGEKPNTPNGEKPNGENENTPNGEKENTPNGENPNTPNGTNENVVVTWFEAGDVGPDPQALTAVTVYVCAVPCSWPISTVVDAVDPDFPSEDAQLYAVIAEPPFDGADQVSLSTPAEGVDADGVETCPGSVVTVTDPDAADN
jgi:hypothetical protein